MAVVLSNFITLVSLTLPDIQKARKQGICQSEVDEVYRTALKCENNSVNINMP